MQALERKASREDYLSTLNSFNNSSNDVIMHFTKEIGWTKPPDGNNMLEIHKGTEKVSETNSINGYSEEPLLPSFLPSAPHSFSVKIDAEKQRNILLPYRKNVAPDLRHPPASAGELTVNFTREERLILYEHTLKNAASVAVPPELLPMEVNASSETQPKELSGLELKKAMRDFKRRRQAYRTKISTKNKSQTEVTREIIHNMMALLGMQEPKLDFPGTSDRLHAPLCNPDCDNDLYTLGKSSEFMTSVHQGAVDSHHVKDMNYTKHQEQKPKRSEQKSHSRSRNPKESVKYQKYDSLSHDSNRFLTKDEKKHRRMEKKCDMKSEGHDTSDKYQPRFKDRGSSQGKEKKRKKDESEYRIYKQRKMSRKKEKYENEERHHRQEAFSSRSKKKEK